GPPGGRLPAGPLGGGGSTGPPGSRLPAGPLGGGGSTGAPGCRLPAGPLGGGGSTGAPGCRLPLRRGLRPGRPALGRALGLGLLAPGGPARRGLGPSSALGSRTGRRGHALPPCHRALHGLGRLLPSSLRGELLFPLVLIGDIGVAEPTEAPLSQPVVFPV